MWSGHGSGHRLRRCSVPAYLLRGERNGARQRVGTIGKRAGAARLTISLSSTAAANYAEYAAEISSGFGEPGRLRHFVLVDRRPYGQWRFRRLAAVARDIGVDDRGNEQRKHRTDRHAGGDDEPDVEAALGAGAGGDEQWHDADHHGG